MRSSALVPRNARCGRHASVLGGGGRTAASRERAVKQMLLWKRLGSDKPQQNAAHMCRPSLFERAERQTAAPARALQAGGRPFEPGTAHLRGSHFRSCLASSPGQPGADMTRACRSLCSSGRCTCSGSDHVRNRSQSLASARSRRPSRRSSTGRRLGVRRQSARGDRLGRAGGAVGRVTRFITGLHGRRPPARSVEHAEDRVVEVIQAP